MTDRQNGRLDGDTLLKLSEDLLSRALRFVSIGDGDDSGN